jgi:general stress protein 26
MRRRQLLEFMRNHSYAVQASVSSTGAPQAAVIGIAVTNALEIVFDSVDSSRKVKNLLVDPRIALVIGGWTPGDERTLQYEGMVDRPQGSELQLLKETYYAKFPTGRDRLCWPGLIYLRVRPTWVRYSDFNRNPPTIVELDGKKLIALK